MYLAELQVRNFRSHKKTRMLFQSGTNTILGENDTGKTNIITAIRMLLDDSYYLSNKTLDKSDFSDDLTNWKGHWIIISAKFKDISVTDRLNEDIESLVIQDEHKFICSEKIATNDTEGTFTLFIRPNAQIRISLSNAENKEFIEIINSISTSDYEYYFSSRGNTDFLDDDVYESIVGKIDNFNYISPSDDNQSILGTKIDPRSFQNLISVVMIDALRDVETQMKKRRNPLSLIINSIQSQISDEKKANIENIIGELNLEISNIDDISEVGNVINNTLSTLLGNVYSPEIKIQSQMNSNIEELSKFIALKSKTDGQLNTLGLGHLNMIYIALKMVEFKLIKNREVLNIMLIEEPEAHIHHHIQRTLFYNINNTEDYTQVIMTTHSTHISEASEISRMNILIPNGKTTHAVQPSTNLDKFGEKNEISRENSLTKSIERYLDSKRSTLLFSKAVILVEGDAEELLIPNLIKSGLGIDLNEIGINIINIGNVHFQYIASLFHEDRIQKKCSIITDLDMQAVQSTSSNYKSKAQTLGKTRKNKLESMFASNNYVAVFTNQYTFEIEFFTEGNLNVLKELIKDEYSEEQTKLKHLKNVESDLEMQAETILTLSNKVGKGWLAIKIAEKIKYDVEIPSYILEAINHASLNIITHEEIKKMMLYYLRHIDTDVSRDLALEISSEGLSSDVYSIFKENYPNSNIQKFLNIRKQD